MRREKATLPILGTIAVDFFKESETVADFMGAKEWSRLRSIPHLGVAASVFNGVHHSRLEYMLLQCAVTGLVAKLHRHEEQFALSSSVTLAGLKEQVSSGEELLKTWFLLSNFGHAQYTYGVERSLLQQAVESSKVADWFTEDIWPSDLRRWGRNVIRKYEYPNFRYLIALRRIASLPPRDRRKRKFASYLRNLLLPLNDLYPDNPATKFKVGRLRELYARIRLLSMVAIDAHYSHHPIAININSAIVGLADLLPSGGAQSSGFNLLLQNAAAWLADELYLHPTSVAAQREYELRFALRFPRRFKEASKTGRRAELLENLVKDGLGPPRPNKLAHLARLTFPRPRMQLMSNDRTHYEAAIQLGKELVRRPSSYISIDYNPFSNAVHVDLLLRRGTAQLADVAYVFARLQAWLRRTIEADSLARVRGISLQREVRQRYKGRDLERQLDRHSGVLQSLFDSVLREFLPSTHRGVISEFAPARRSHVPVLARLRMKDGSLIDAATPRLRYILQENPDSHPPERLQEIRCLLRVLNETDADFVVICPEKYYVHDQLGRRVDDWDGIQIAISGNKLTLTIVEAKTGGSARQRADEAFAQLAQTRRILRLRYDLPYRRRRIPGLGAALDLYAEARQDGPS